jgi:pentapeptide MXKDX repeat protein
MTFSNRIVLGISAAAIFLSLALAPVAFADDPMSQDIDFRNNISRGAGVKKDSVPRDSVVSRRAAKKDDGTRKYSSSR